MGNWGRLVTLAPPMLWPCRRGNIIAGGCCLVPQGPLPSRLLPCWPRSAPTPTYRVPTSAGQLLPEEVSAHVLAKLLEAAEEFGGEAISKAVISVPAYFDEEQREATITAGRVAGLETVRLIR